MNLLVDRVKYDDFHPLLELCNEINRSEVEGIDLFVRSSCSLEDHYALSLIRSVNQKLRVVHLHDSFGKNFWRLAMVFCLLLFCIIFFLSFSFW